MTMNAKPKTKKTRPRKDRDLLKGRKINELNPDEVAVWKSLASGYTLKQTAQRLGLQMYQVTGLRRRVCIVTDARNVAHLTRLAIKHGLIEP